MMQTKDERALLVTVGEQGFEASLTIPSLAEREAAVTANQCEQTLKQAGVVFGIDYSHIKDLVETGPRDQPVVIARGVRPRDGQDAKIELCFETEKLARPREREDGSVDYHDLGLVENVTSGHVLAIKTLATVGQKGMTVLGEEVQGTPGRDVTLRAGENTVLNADGLAVIGQVEGQPVWQSGNRVSVHSIYRVSGDVDFSVGNIKFVGTVQVNGGIAPGFTITARGDVHIAGSSSAELLKAGQDVMVNGGIQGLKRGRVEAGRDIRARFIENAWVQSERSVYANSVLHSGVECRGRLEVTGGKGLIAGGIIRAGEAVMARIIGTPLATQTEIHVGTDPVARKQLVKAVTETEQCQQEILQLEAQLEGLHSLRAFKSTDGQDAQVIRLGRRLRLLRDHLADLEKTVAKLTLKVGNGDGGLVQADIVYPGVKLSVGFSSMFVYETRRDLRLQPGSKELRREE